jgi:hypothetical protein
MHASIITRDNKSYAQEEREKIEEITLITHANKKIISERDLIINNNGRTNI